MPGEAHSFESADGTRYVYELSDITELNKDQRSKLKARARLMSDGDIRLHGIRLVLTEEQRKEVELKVSKLTSGKPILKMISGLLTIEPHARRRMQDPARSLRSAEEVADALQKGVRVGDCRMHVKSAFGQTPVTMAPNLSYSVHSQAADGSVQGRLVIRILGSAKGREHIYVLTVLPA